MSIPTDHRFRRRAFLEGLLLAACGGEVITRAAVQDGREKTQQSEVPAQKAADARVPRLEDSGMRPKLLAQVRGLLAQPRGLIVCCGPTGPIRTATLYACLGELVPARKKVFSIEDPIAYHLDKVTQAAADARNGRTYAGGLRAILGQDPDAVMIGEIHDQKTVSIACRAAMNGPLVLAGFQAGDTRIALLRLLDLGVDPSLLASGLSAILAQRSVRSLCDACKEPYKPKPEFLQKANIPADKVDVFYRRPQDPQQACPRCGGTGVSGQTGIFELLVVTEPIRGLIGRVFFAMEPITAEARKNGLIYIEEDGLRQVILGRTSIEELLQAIKEGTP